VEILISGASTGIGKACALELAEKGHHIWAGVRSPKSFTELKSLNLEKLTPIFLDVTDEESIESCLSEIQAAGRGLDGLVNNAGIAIGGPMEAVPMEDWRRQFETNVFGLIALTQAALPHLRQSHGRVVNISSISGLIGVPFLGPYSASKFAVESISDCLRREMRRFGVQVAVVEPGPINTPIWAKARCEGQARARAFSPEMQKVYGSSLSRFSEKVQDSVRSAAPVSVVVKAVVHALTAKRPRTRYPVGRGVRASSLLFHLLPDRWVDRAF